MLSCLVSAQEWGRTEIESEVAWYIKGLRMEKTYANITAPTN